MNRKKGFALLLLAMLIGALVAVPALAAAEEIVDAPDTAFEYDEAYMTIATADAEAASTSGKALGSGIAIGIAAAGGAIAMGLAVGKAAEGIARQPEAQGNIRTVLMLGLVFIETAIIYALLAVILIIFVL